MLKLLHLAFFGLALWSSVGAEQADSLSSPSWILSQAAKQSSEAIQLNHIISEVAGAALQNSRPTISGGLLLNGPKHRLSSLHNAGPWKIEGCANDNRKSQTVFAYCPSKNPLVECGDIFLGGAKDTIVLLPDNCGASPFAHVVKFAPVHDKNPSKYSVINHANLSVFELTFDYNFKAIPYRRGEVPTTLHMEFSDIPGYSKLSDFGKKRTYGQWLSGIGQLTAQFNRSYPIDKKFSTKLAEMSQKCKGFSMDFTVTTKGRVTGDVAFGYYFTGTIIPPAVNDHFVYLNSYASAKANVVIDGAAVVNFNGAQLNVLPPVTFPGLSFPGIFALGPYFEILAGLKGELALSGTISAKTGFTVPLVEASFGNGTAPHSPPKAHSFASVTLGKNLQVAAGVTIYLSPQAGIQVNVLDGLIDADVALRPTAGITAGGHATVSGNLTKTLKVTDPCVEVDGSVDLFWIVEGKVANWGKAIGGRIWGIRKKFYEKCWKSLPAPIRAWKKIGTTAQPHPRALSFSGMSCPSTPPF